LGAPVSVPDSEDPVWVRIELKPTLWGRIIAALDKPPILYIRVHSRAGTDQTYRFVPGTAAAGFLISPIIANRTEFCLLQGSDWARQLAPEKITSFVIAAQTTDGTTADYQNDYDISFSNLLIPHRDISAVPGIAEFTGFRDFLEHLSIQPPGAKVQIMPIRSGQNVLLVPKQTVLLSPAKAGMTHLHVKFGLLNADDVALPPGADRTNGVVFQVYAFTADSVGRLAGSPVWARKLDPNHLAADRGMQEADVNLGATTPSIIGLATIPVTKGATNLAYWAGVRFSP